MFKPSSNVQNPNPQDMESIVRKADIIIAAAGQAGLIKGSWVKPGAAIIDVGTNAVDDASKKAGYRLVGDADYEECQAVAGAITPVPGMNLDQCASWQLIGWLRTCLADFTVCFGDF